jgi:hypothetical protein
VAAKVMRPAPDRADHAGGGDDPYGIPEEMLTDNGKQFTDRFGRGGEVLFDRI